MKKTLKILKITPPKNKERDKKAKTCYIEYDSLFEAFIVSSITFDKAAIHCIDE